MSKNDMNAQESYDGQIAILRGIYGKVDFDFECTANDLLGENALKNIAEQFGHFDSGWLEDVDFEASLRDRILAHSYKETVAAYAMAKSAFREARTVKQILLKILWILALLLCVNMCTILFLWLGV
jgi:hypothetical protein